MPYVLEKWGGRVNCVQLVGKHGQLLLGDAIFAILDL